MTYTNGNTYIVLLISRSLLHFFVVIAEITYLFSKLHDKLHYNVKYNGDSTIVPPKVNEAS